VAEKDLVASVPLLNWLRVAFTSTSLPNNAQGSGPPTCALTLTVPMADQYLISHRVNILNQVLPVLNKPTKSLEVAITQMAAAVTQSTNDARLYRE